MKKLVVLGLVFVAVFAAGAFAYAHWNRNIEIGGTVATGSLDVAWKEVQAWDTEPPGKDISHVSCTVDTGDPSTLHLGVTNGYPSIEYYNQVEILNTGTIPLHLNQLWVHNDYSWLEVELIGLQTVGRTDGWLQLHPGESASVIIHTHLLELAPCGVFASFDIVVGSVQYNQDPYDIGLMKWGSDIVLNEEVPVGFLNWSVSDNEEYPFPDVCEASIDAFDTAGDGDVDCLLLVLDRWYDGYTATVAFDIHNCGSTLLQIMAVNILPGIPETVEVAVIGLLHARIGPGDCAPGWVVAEVCANMPGYCGFFASIECCETLE